MRRHHDKKRKKGGGEGEEEELQQRVQLLNSHMMGMNLEGAAAPSKTHALLCLSLLYYSCRGRKWG